MSSGKLLPFSARARTSPTRACTSPLPHPLPSEACPNSWEVRASNIFTQNFPHFLVTKLLCEQRYGVPGFTLSLKIRHSEQELLQNKLQPFRPRQGEWRGLSLFTMSCNHKTQLDASQETFRTSLEQNYHVKQRRHSPGWRAIQRRPLMQAVWEKESSLVSVALGADWKLYLSPVSGDSRTVI